MTRNRFKLYDLNISLFDGLNAATLQKWEEIAVMYQLEAGEKLYTQGDIAQTFYIIVQGGVRLIEYTPDGKAVIIQTYGKGDLFGLLALSYEYKHTATVEAIDVTQVLAFRATDAHELLARQSKLALRLIACLSQNIYHYHNRIRHLAAEKTEKRLAHALLDFYKKFGIVQNDRYVIQAELSQRDLSQFTGTTVETVNRYLRTWEKQGWIALSYKHIDILKPEKLEAIAASLSSNRLSASSFGVGSHGSL